MTFKFNQLNEKYKFLFNKQTQPCDFLSNCWKYCLKLKSNTEIAFDKEVIKVAIKYSDHNWTHSTHYFESWLNSDNSVFYFFFFIINLQV